APVEYSVSNALPLKVLPSVRVDPTSGPIGTKFVLFGKGFGANKEPGDAILLNGQPATVAKWTDGVIVAHVPLGASSGPAVVYRWHDDKIDVWVPFSAKDGPVVVRRGATTPKADGSCCAERGIVSTVAGSFTVATPKVDSFQPASGGLDEIVTIKGSGFG